MSAETLHPTHPSGPTPRSRPQRPEPDEERARPQRALVALGLLPMLALLAFMLGLAFGVRGTDVWMLGLALLTSAIAFVPLALDQGRAPSRRHLLISMFALAFMAYHVVPVFTNYLPGDEPKIPAGMRWATLSPEDVVRGQIVALSGVVALLLAYALPFGRAAATIVPALRREWSLREAFLAVAILGLAGWFVFLLGQFRLLPAFLGTGVVSQIARGYVGAIAILALIWLRLGSRTAAILLGVLVPLTMAFNFFTGSKKAFLAAAAMVALAWILHHARVQARWVVAGILALVVLYPVSQFYRNVVLQGYTLGAVDILADPVDALGQISSYVGTWDSASYLQQGFEAAGNRLDGLGRASLIIRETPRSVPFQGGWTLANIFIAYIPRILWPEKPIITIGQWVTDTYGSGPDIKSATGPTWIGEFYFNFGVPGVIGGMAILGLLLRLAHEVLLVRSRTIPAFYLVILILFETVTTVGGGVVGMVNGVIFAIGPVVGIHLLIRILGGPGRSPVGPRTLPQGMAPETSRT